MVEQPVEHRYAGFPRRLRAAVLDSAILLTIIVGSVFILDATSSNVAGQGSFAIAVIVLIVYEPILVSTRGQTIGHRAMNLRVTDEASEATLSFTRALIRGAIKAGLGLPSFVLMALTRRHQAIHDRVTRSVVVADDLSRASQLDFHKERPTADGMVQVSALRRIIIIVSYTAGVYAVLLVVSVLFTSEECLLLDQCTASDDRTASLAGILLMIGFAATVILGWRGKLPGARMRPASSREPSD